MSFLNRRRGQPDPMKERVAKMNYELIENAKKEIKEIENFFIILQSYQNSETLLMNLEEFDEFLGEKKEYLDNEMRVENNTLKINSISQELKNIDYMKRFINIYIAKSSTGIYDIKKILKGTTNLLQFINILKEREKYLQILLDINAK